jgi:hypothetical protein
MKPVNIPRTCARIDIVFVSSFDMSLVRIHYLKTFGDSFEKIFKYDLTASFVKEENKIC